MLDVLFQTDLLVQIIQVAIDFHAGIAGAAGGVQFLLLLSLIHIWKLIDIQSRMTEGKGTGYKRWLTKHNLDLYKRQAPNSSKVTYCADLPHGICIVDK